MRYEATYSIGHEPRTLIFPEGTYEALPFEVRLMGPWYGCKYIDGKKLKAAHRYDIMQQGYTVLRNEEMKIQNAA